MVRSDRQPCVTLLISRDGELDRFRLRQAAWTIVNRGSYGDQQFIRPETFQRLLPQPLQVADPGYTADEGIGIHWQRHFKPGVPRDSIREEDLLFGPKSLGHGSFSGCIFFVDPNLELVVVQVRKQSGPRSAEWSPKFFQTIAEVLSERAAVMRNRKANASQLTSPRKSLSCSGR